MIRRCCGIALLGAVTLSGAPSFGTVFEFTARGAQIVRLPEVIHHETPTPVLRSTRQGRGPEQGSATTAARLKHRTLAEQTALRFAGDAGVRKAGLSAVAFTRLFVALIDQESRFNAEAVSPKGAQGLGQLMPATAARLGVDDPFDPIQNLTGAARYLTQHLERFGSAPLALAAYNAGAHRVEEYGGIPPFRETEGFVRAITRAAGLADVAATPVNMFQDDASPPSPSPSPSPTRDERTSVWEF